MRYELECAGKIHSLTITQTFPYHTETQKLKTHGREEAGPRVGAWVGAGVAHMLLSVLSAAGLEGPLVLLLLLLCTSAAVAVAAAGRGVGSACL